MKKQDDHANTHRDDVRIRPLEPHDRSPIEDMVVSSGMFNDVEIATALEPAAVVMKYFSAGIETLHYGGGKQ